ncbi:MAG: sodium-dependent transporter [Deltaproteobacteria bacterium]|nr:sodium-dependent transporter [Deltaproteobacteria bacterium]
MAGPVSQRGFWASRVGFILAAAGSAVGLGNIWKFPYVTGNNGGGLFILIYLACVVAVGIPIMNAEIMMGRSTARSPVPAFRSLAGKGSPWTLTGWMGVAAGFVILSYYSVVAGWSVYYTALAVGQGFTANTPQELDVIKGLFDELLANPMLNVSLHAGFMAATIGVVIGGVQSGIERWSRILMPTLFTMLLGLGVYALTLPGAGSALNFMFGLHTDQLKPAGFLEAFGQAFFSLSLGMGAMLTYGSYLPRQTSILGSSMWVALLDTGVALLSSIVIFPVTYTYGIDPSAGPGLVFQSLPMAFAQMPGGRLLASAFFMLLVFAALTSSISLLEVVASTFIDLLGWTRSKAVIVTGTVIFFVGVPSALSGGAFFGGRMKDAIGLSFFDVMDKLSSNWMLPLGGLLIAIFVGWRMNADKRKEEFSIETPGWSYGPWLGLLRYLAPVAVLAVMAKSTGLFKALGLKWGSGGG